MSKTLIYILYLLVTIMKSIKNSAALITLMFVFQLIGGNCTIGNAATIDSPANPTAQTSTLQSKEAFVNNMAQTVLAIIKDENKPFAAKQVTLKQEFTSVVDSNWIARFVLGKTWNTATAEQKEHYTALYRTYLTNSYISNFNEDSERKLKDIKILSINDAEDNNFSVHTEMLLTDADNVRVDYLVSEKAGEYKIIDIVIEGISLLSTHRSEFSELASAGGVDGVIGRLEQMVGQDKSTISLSMK